jgi:hypothetical protein
MRRRANQITGAKVAGACSFVRSGLSHLSSSRSGAYRHFAQFGRSTARQKGTICHKRC